MADFNWDSHPVEDEKSKAQAPAFDWDAHPTEDDEESGPSMLESGIRGAAQGLSFGFADEATGALEAGKDLLLGDTDVMENYRKHRDESREAYKAAEKANPGTYLTSQIAGGIAPAVLTGGGSAPATMGSMIAQGAAQGLGSTEADLTEGDLAGAAKDVATGAAFGAGAGLAGKALSKIPVKRVAEAIGGRLDDVAEDLAVKATGATGKQAEQFADDAGRQLLDRGIVRFGRTPEDVAMRAAQANQEAGEAISSALKQLDAKGATASIDNVIGVIEDQVDELKRVPGNEKIIRQLENELDNLYERAGGKLGSELPISTAEEGKRAFQGQTNYASPEAEKKASAKMARAFKDEVERAALEADPGLAGQFTEAKKTYGLLAPIQEAAEKRASQLNQSPFGGFGDFAAGAAGSIGGAGGISGTVAARRVLAPRLASSGAVLADNLSEVVKNSPQLLGRFAKPLQAAAARGGNALAATHFILQQTQPEYREMMLKSEDDR